MSQETEKTPVREPLTEAQRRMAEDAIGVAVAYVAKMRIPRRERDDCIQVGHLAVAMAARRYDAGIGVDFGTFAYQRVRRAVADYLADLRPIHVPIYNRRSIYRSKAGYVAEARAKIAAARFESIASPNGYEDSDFPSRELRPDEEAERREAVAAVRDAIRRLPALHRATIEECDVKERRIIDFAAERCVHPNTVQSSRRRGMERLRKYLASFDESGRLCVREDDE